MCEDILANTEAWGGVAVLNVPKPKHIFEAAGGMHYCIYGTLTCLEEWDAKLLDVFCFPYMATPTGICASHPVLKFPLFIDFTMNS